eukprot:CAMPEP_0114581048 /NCGR_PEP_ID=MMETSP0125-20121206/5195_1 /TAXON_ID=485358 ORGANISM="Aristerostoma sp., Strain ATCC 50986" /NCGR_SAMPLE_ID=MMETSP0125 /ASSEMBLY_ACC=CAM_ASM_000245 /LENGTH=103 /DNA_ID=CAMNT_0001772943 /DNA_START=230 /DNA_END=542 /DNA_ORIENTATION=-
MLQQSSFICLSLVFDLKVFILDHGGGNSSVTIDTEANASNIAQVEIILGVIAPIDARFSITLIKEYNGSALANTLHTEILIRLWVINFDKGAAVTFLEDELAF